MIAGGSAADGTAIDQKVVIEAIAAALPSVPPLTEVFPQAKDGETFGIRQPAGFLGE